MLENQGSELEELFHEKDPAQSGVIDVKTFSECLREVDEGIDGDIKRGRDGRPEEGRLSRADRKLLYRKWAVHGQVGQGARTSSSFANPML